MTALTGIRRAGFSISLTTGGFSVTPSSQLSQQQREFLKSHRGEIIAELESLTVVCYTPNGAALKVVADSPEHVEQLLRWNPKRLEVDNG